VEKDYAEWEVNVPELIKNEPIWKFPGYRKSLYLYDLIWEDTGTWVKEQRSKSSIAPARYPQIWKKDWAEAMARKCYTITGLHWHLRVKQRDGIIVLAILWKAALWKRV
jgi:hypothetical protein